MPSLYLKNKFKLRKRNNSVNDSERRESRLALSCSEKLSTLLRGITSKDQGDFYCLNIVHSFGTENKIKSHEKVCKKKDFRGILMPLEKYNILEFNQYMKLYKYHTIFMVALNI